MSHRPHPEPQWLRRLADACLPAARDQRAQTISRLIRPEAARRGLDPNDLAVRIAKLWQLQGHIPDWHLRTDD